MTGFDPEPLADREALRSRLGYPGVSIRGHVPRLNEHLAAADLA